VSAPEFPALLQAFFTERLLKQCQASPHTIRSYRNTFRLLLRFAQTRLHRGPSHLLLADLDTAFLSSFLDHVERERGNCARTRNVRLAAIHAFFRFVALAEPSRALHCQQVLAIPGKRFDRGLVEFLDEDEVKVLLAAPDPAT
jgi:site-specific recombinase XerD